MSDTPNEPEQAQTKVGAEQEYNAGQIDKLEGLEAVRKRPGMYIGDPDERGLHHCVFEVLDNSIDEHLAGYCSKIKVAIHVDGSISVSDNGRGIPVDMHPKFGIPAVELVLTNLHAGGKFGQGAYKYSGGLHGVGAKCVNALSDWFRADITRGGKVHRIAFERGKTTEPLHIVGDADPKKAGTAITFFPDATIFVDTIVFQFDRLATRLRELAFLNPGLTIELDDERPSSQQEPVTCRTACRPHKFHKWILPWLCAFAGRRFQGRRSEFTGQRIGRLVFDSGSDCRTIADVAGGSEAAIASPFHVHRHEFAASSILDVRDR